MRSSPISTSDAGRALLQGLRRPGDEAQLTQALNGVFTADAELAASFLVEVLRALGAPTQEVPERLGCRAEEVVEQGRLDLHFTDGDRWDVIVELKIHAGYGRNQLGRYIDALGDAEHAYVVAITRDVALYGEPPKETAGWLGSLRWRDLLPALRTLMPRDEALRVQWPHFLEILELEGSMGFTQPDPALFEAWGQLRRATDHVEAFVEAVRGPVLNALRDALGGGEDAADFYRGRGGRPVLSRGRWGKADMPFRVPGDGKVRVRAGLFAYNPPTRFYVAPEHGRSWAARKARLPEAARGAVDGLIAAGFRAHDLHAFLELDEQLLLDSQLEPRVVEWAHERFSDISKSGILNHDYRAAAGIDPVPEDMDVSP